MKPVRQITVTLHYETDQPLALAEIKEAIWTSPQSKWERNLKLVCDKIVVRQVRLRSRHKGSSK